jgi:3'-phosphoadenosine 5'-phosphosulfate sulfotransferase (PAPS reductase)/FAD synthetase
MKIKIIVPVSGGKDSQACLKLALESYEKEEVLGLFCDTKFEHPITYNHIDKMREMYGVKIDTITAGSVPENCLKYGRFPGGGKRHCTGDLKIIPSKKYYIEFAKDQGGFQVWYGMRGGESNERAIRYADKINNEVYPPNEVLKKYPKYLYTKLGVTFRLPILDWTLLEVYSFLNGEENTLYSQGFDRVGCFPCLAS